MKLTHQMLTQFQGMLVDYSYPLSDLDRIVVDTVCDLMHEALQDADKYNEYKNSSASDALRAETMALVDENQRLKQKIDNLESMLNSALGSRDELEKFLDEEGRRNNETYKALEQLRKEADLAYKDPSRLNRLTWGEACAILLGGKIDAIKMVRDRTGLCLTYAKSLVESADLDSTDFHVAFGRWKNSYPTEHFIHEVPLIRRLKGQELTSMVNEFLFAMNGKDASRLVAKL